MDQAQSSTGFVSLRTKFALWVSLAASIFIALSTYFSYRTQVANTRHSIDEKVESVLQNSIAALELALWNYDQEQLNHQAESILMDDDILSIEIFAGTGQGLESLVRRKKGGADKSEPYDITTPLLHDKQSIGQLRISYTHEIALVSKRSQIIQVLLWQLGMFIPFVFSIFWMAHRLFTQRMNLVIDHIRANPVASEKMSNLHRNETAQTNDEIDVLAKSVDSFYEQALLQTKQLTQLKLEAEKNSSLKSLFLASMSHELRTPLNVILGVTEMIGDTAATPETREYLDLQAKAGEHLRHLIDDILDLNKIEAGELHISYGTCDLHELLDASIKMLVPKAKEQGNRLILERDANLPKWLETDQSRLMQIVLNLVGNACKFTFSGQITLKAKFEHNHLFFAISDTGIGIPTEALDSIFSPFKQIHSDKTANNNGAGIGLAVCRGLALAMNGSLVVQSQLNVGTTFTLKLPYRAGNSIQTLPNPQPSRLSDPLTQEPIDKNRLAAQPAGLRILVAEDTEENVMILKAFLKKLPYELEVVERGDLAVDQFMENYYDVILMDMQMPVMNGYEATRKIREIESLEKRTHTPIIALTAYAAANDLKKCLDAGCDSFVTKPFKRDLILLALSEITRTTGSAKKTG